MKKILYPAIIVLALASCDTPGNIIGNPENTTNTSGTTGSANMTNSNKANPVITQTPGTPTDSAVIKKDTVPKIPE